MIQEWVEQALAPRLIEIEGVAYIQVAPDVVMAVTDFVTVFGGAIAAELDKPEGDRDFYAALCGSHTFTWEGQELTMTAAEMDYVIAFNTWHAEGLI